MATVEGIRTPIVLDLTDIPRSVAKVQKELKRLQKMAIKTDIKIDGRKLTELSRKGLLPLIKNFKILEEKALTAKKRFDELAKAIAKVRAGGAFGKGQAQQLAAMKGVGPKTREAMQAYKGAHAGLQEDPGNKAKMAAYEAAQKRLIALMQKAQGVQNKTINQTKRYFEIVAQGSKYRSKFKQQEIAENKKIYRQFLQLARLHRAGRATEQEMISLHQKGIQLLTRKVKMHKKNRDLVKDTAKIAEKAGKSAGSLMGGGLWGRAKWFAQLRVLWGVMQAAAAVVEQWMELDKASQRAMRTMYKATGDYGKLAKRVRQEIAKTAAVTGDTYQNIGEALYQLSSAGLSATESFAALNSVVKLAKITESDMTDTTKVVAGAYNNFKDTITGATSETEKFMKISSTLSYVWKRNQIDMNELVQGLNQSAQSGKLAGLRFEELATILGNMGTKMIRSGRAGRMFRSAVINIAQKSDEVREAFDIAFDPMKPLNFMQVMDKMKIKWDESNKSAQTTATIFSIFGKRGAPALIAMLDSWGKIRREVDGLGSAFEMAVEQHETLLRTQQHLSENLAVTGKQVFEYLTDWKDLSQHINKLLLGIRQGFTTSAVMKESRKEVVDLKKAYKDLGATQERLVELTAQQNVLRAQGAPEDVLRWYDKLILKVKAVKAGYMKEGKALKEVEDNKLSNAIANADMVLGYKKAEEAINKMNLASGHHKKSLEEMVPEIVKAREELNEAKKTYATYAALVAKDIATMPPEVKKSMADALKFYQNLVKQFFDLKNMMAKDVVSAGKAMYQQDPMKVEGRGGSEAEEAYAIQMADIKWQNTKRQMEAENELATARSDHDLTMQARNMSERESDQLKRDRAVEQLEQQDMIWAAEQAYLEEKRAVEEGALLEAEYEMDVDKVQTKLQSLNDIGVAEDELAAKRELQKVKIETAAQSYDQYQRKRIAGIYAEKGAIAASGAMWAAYGKTIGTYASSMVDQWKNMFAEMGKESKTAWKIYQGIAIAQAIVDTYKTATAGASALAGIPFVGPALAIAWVATSIASGMMRVMQIRQQKPQTAAKGGVFQGTNFEAYGTGGVTSGVATGIIGDNPSGKELVIPSENIAKNRVDGYVQPSGGGGGAPITIANLLTNEQIAGAMKSDAGENVIINAVTESNRTRGTMYRSTKETVGKR